LGGGWADEEVDLPDPDDLEVVDVEHHTFNIPLSLEQLQSIENLIQAR
jgi:hypothetical protein